MSNEAVERCSIRETGEAGERKTAADPVNRRAVNERIVTEPRYCAEAISFTRSRSTSPPVRRLLIRIGGVRILSLLLNA